LLDLTTVVLIYRERCQKAMDGVQLFKKEEIPMKYRISLITLLMLLFLLCPTGTMALTGGPDRGGYTFSDTGSFSWEELGWTSTISKETWNADKYARIPIKIGFNFPFYGKSYSTVYVSRYGYLTFSEGSEKIFREGKTIEPIPTRGGFADNFIAGMWAYLLPEV